MEFTTMIEIVAAAHLSQYVNCKLGEARSGLMLVSPPGGFKSTFIETLEYYRNTLTISDANIQSMIRMKSSIQSGFIRTLGFADFEKIFKRHPSVASNLEGTIMSLVEEGFKKASFENQQVNTIVSRCVVISGMTLEFYERKYEAWKNNGFLRRFVFATYVLSPESSELIDNLLLTEKRLADLDPHFRADIPMGGRIPETLDALDLELIQRATNFIEYRSGNIKMLQRMLNVLRWKFGPVKAREIFMDFLPCLGKNGAVLNVKELRGNSLLPILHKQKLSPKKK